MDSLENNISNNNKIPGSPGCDSFTRPEEISALSKFLSKKRKFLENNLELEDYLEDVPGKTTGKFHIIDNLEDKVINLSREEDVIKLSNKILSLDKTPDTNIEKVGLPKHIESIETNEVKELVNKLVKISENDIKDYKNLDNTKLNLTVDKEIKLDNITKEEKIVLKQEDYDKLLGDLIVLIDPEKGICISDVVCPNHTCVKQGWVKRVGYPVTCLPNGVYVIITSPSPDLDIIT